MSDVPDKELTFSFVVPVYNEQEGLNGFYTRLKAVADGLGKPYEILFVDDGSTDDTGLLLHRLSGEDEHIKVIELSRNFGHQLAVTAGLDCASGRAVVTLDGDCQHPPELINELVARWREGFEVVGTVRKDPGGASVSPKGTGRLTCRLVSLLTGVAAEKSDFRLLDRKAVDAIKAHREAGRFVGGLVDRVGFRRTLVPYVAEKRAAGKSSYSSEQFKSMACAGLFNFSLRPLRIAAVLGALMLTIAVTYAITCGILLPLGIWLTWQSHLVMFVIAMFGLQFVLLGILGEYVGRTFDQAKQRPLYIVREKIGFPDESAPQDPDKSDAEESVQYRIFT